MSTAIEAARVAAAWVARRNPWLEADEVLGLAWEAAAGAPAAPRRAAVFAMQDEVRRLTRCRAVNRVAFQVLAEHHGARRADPPEPDRYARLGPLLARLTPRQADALAGWLDDRTLASEAARLGVSQDAVSQLRFRALSVLGGESTRSAPGRKGRAR